MSPDTRDTPETPDPRRLTEVLREALDAETGDREEVHQLLVFELRRIARSTIGKTGHARRHEVTQLVNEAWIKMAGNHPRSWRDREHFKGWAARVVRSILIDQARARGALKRGGEAAPVPLTESIACTEGPELDLLALDEALDELEQVDPKGARVIELCYFGGLTQVQAAEILGIDESTVKRRWRMARGWLEARLDDDHTQA